MEIVYQISPWSSHNLQLDSFAMETSLVSRLTGEIHILSGDSLCFTDYALIIGQIRLQLLSFAYDRHMIFKLILRLAAI